MWVLSVLVCAKCVDVCWCGLSVLVCVKCVGVC